MKVNELKEDKLIIVWFDTINASEHTKRNYMFAMQFFTECVKKTPEELILEAEAEIISGILPRERKIKTYFIKFRKSLQDGGSAPMTVKTHMSGVKSFYITNDIEIPTLPKSSTKAKPREENNEIPTLEDLRAVLKVCDPLERALLLVGVSSGLSANEIINLKVKDFKNGFDDKTNITILKLRRIKTKVDFITFLSPEASQAVQDYLSYRDKTIKTENKKRITLLDKQKVFSYNDFLFIGYYIPNAFLKTKDDKVRKLKTGTFMHIYRNLSEKAQKNATKGNWNLIRSHNMRKFFNSALLNAGADSFFVEFCMGHTLDSTKAAYFRANSEQLKETYKKYIPFLTVQKALNISESPEYQSITKENQVLRAETAKHVVERSELQDLRKELETAKKQTEQTRKEILDDMENRMMEVINKQKKVFKNVNAVEIDYEEDK